MARSGATSSRSLLRPSLPKPFLSSMATPASRSAPSSHRRRVLLLHSDRSSGRHIFIGLALLSKRPRWGEGVGRLNLALSPWISRVATLLAEVHKKVKGCTYSRSVARSGHLWPDRASHVPLPVSHPPPLPI